MMTLGDDDAALMIPEDDEIELAQPSSWPARLIFAALGAFFIAVVLTWTPSDLPTLAWRLAYWLTAGTVLLAGGVLPLYAAITGADTVWRLRPGLLLVEIRSPLWRRRLQLTGDDIAAVTIEAADSSGGLETVVVRLDVRGRRKPVLSPTFTDPMEAEWFADTLASALDMAPPANLIPPGRQPNRPWTRGPLRRGPTWRPGERDGAATPAREAD